MLFLLLLGKDRMTDRVADAPISSAGVSAMASNAAEPFPQPSFMQLSCFINSPVIGFKFPFKVDSERNSFLGYRFDENPDHDPNARFVASASTVIIEDDREVAEFARELATAKVLYIPSARSTLGEQPLSSKSTARRLQSPPHTPPVRSNRQRHRNASPSPG